MHATATTFDHLAMALDPAILMEAAGFTPDPWQYTLLRSTSRRLLVNVSRQSGKSTSTAALALHGALFDPGSLTLLVSASLRQSGELFRKVVSFYAALGKPIEAVEDNAQSLALANGSRVVSLPGNPDKVRGFSAPRLIVIDESAQVDDSMFYALSPMMAISRGRTIELSTPYGRRGHFFEAWTAAGDDWQRIMLRATDNPRFDRAFLEEESRILGPRWFGQEYLCEFHDTVGQVFSSESIEAALDNDLQPLFPD